MWTLNNMAYSDRIIIQSIEALQGRNDVTVHDIAAHAKIPYGTVKRAISRLESSNQIVRCGPGRRWGSQYQIKPPVKTKESA